MANINRALIHRGNIDKQEKLGQFKATPVLEQQEHSFPGHKKSFTGIRKVGYTKPHISILMRNRWTLNTHWLHFFLKSNEFISFFFLLYLVIIYVYIFYFFYLILPPDSSMNKWRWIENEKTVFLVSNSAKIVKEEKVTIEHRLGIVTTWPKAYFCWLKCANCSKPLLWPEWLYNTSPSRTGLGMYSTTSADIKNEAIKSILSSPKTSPHLEWGISDPLYKKEKWFNVLPLLSSTDCSHSHKKTPLCYTWCRTCEK